MTRPNWLDAVCEHYGHDPESWVPDTDGDAWTRLGEQADGEAVVSVYHHGWVWWELGSLTIHSDVHGDVLTTLIALEAAAAAFEAAIEAARVKS